MFDIFQPIIAFVAFIIDSIKSLISIVGMAVNTFTELFAMLPPVISVPAGLLLLVCVLYKILGRESGG